MKLTPAAMRPFLKRYREIQETFEFLNKAQSVIATPAGWTRLAEARDTLHSENRELLIGFVDKFLDRKA